MFGRIQGKKVQAINESFHLDIKKKNMLMMQYQIHTFRLIRAIKKKKLKVQNSFPQPEF